VSPGSAAAGSPVVLTPAAGFCDLTDDNTIIVTSAYNAAQIEKGPEKPVAAAVAVAPGSFTLSIPATAAAGTYTLVSVCETYDGTGAIDRESLTVTGGGNGSAAKSGITLSQTIVAPGSKLGFTAFGYKPGEKVQVTLHSTPVDAGTFTANSNGVVSGTVTIPTDFTLGQHSLEAKGSVDLTAKFTVAGVPVSAADVVTHDGGSVGIAGAVAAGVVALGAAAAGTVVIRQRRRATQAL